MIATNIPATALLELEKRITEIHQLISSAPTLDPAKGYQPDPNRSNAQFGTIFKSRDEKRAVTEKQQIPLVMYEATKEHPAQVQLVSKDVAVADRVSITWSGLLTTSAKGDMLERTERLKVAVQKAIARANAQEVDTQERIAGNLFGYIFNGK